MLLGFLRVGGVGGLGVGGHVGGGVVVGGFAGFYTVLGVGWLGGCFCFIVCGLGGGDLPFRRRTSSDAGRVSLPLSCVDGRGNANPYEQSSSPFPLHPPGNVDHIGYKGLRGVHIEKR